jgi:toxin-antitoxin system PIN domain toxin
VLVDANILLFAVDRESAFHEPARDWLTRQLNGTRRVGFPWPVLTAFLRISTNPRAAERALEPSTAWARVDDWLAAGPAWIPTPGSRHAEILGGLVAKYRVRGNLIADAHLAALALEHGLTICSADTDFARFTEAGWLNPLAGG